MASNCVSFNLETLNRNYPYFDLGSNKILFPCFLCSSTSGCKGTVQDGWVLSEMEREIRVYEEERVSS